MDNKTSIDEIVMPFLKGDNLDLLIVRLSTYSVIKDENARNFFKKNTDDAQRKSILHALIGDEQAKIDRYIKEYDEWRQNLNISESLLHFLEFLAQKESHRIRYLVKQIYQTNPPIKYQKAYLFLISVIFCAGIYFANHEAAWTYFLFWLKETLPKLGSELLHVVLKPHNFSLIILAYQTIRFFLDIYFILRNHATSNEHKAKKIFRMILTNALNLSAQLLNFIFASYSNLTNYLFISAGLIDLIWSLTTFYYLENAPHPNEQKHEHFEDFSEACEKYYYYLRKKKQFQLECIALFFTFSAGLASILLGPQVLCLGTVCAVLQFLISLTKNYYKQSYEYQFAASLQDRVSEFKTKPSLNHLSIFTQLPLKPVPTGHPSSLSV